MSIFSLSRHFFFLPLLLFTLYTSVFFSSSSTDGGFIFLFGFYDGRQRKKKQTSQISFHGSALTFSHEFLGHLIPTPSSDRYCKNGVDGHLASDFEKMIGISKFLLFQWKHPSSAFLHNSFFSGWVRLELWGRFFFLLLWK